MQRNSIARWNYLAIFFSFFFLTACEDADLILVQNTIVSNSSNSSNSSADGNNYTTGLSVLSSGNLFTVELSRFGASNLSANFTSVQDNNSWNETYARTIFANISNLELVNTTANSKAGVDVCTGGNSTHASVVNGTNTSGVTCILVARDPGSSSSVASGKNFYDFNMTLSDIPNANNTIYNNTNLTLYLGGNHTYEIDCGILNDAAAATTGVQLRVNTSNSPSAVVMVWTSAGSATAIESFSGTNTATNAFADAGSTTAAVSIGQLGGMVTTGVGDSVFTVESRSEVAGSLARIRRGSYCRAVKYI